LRRELANTKNTGATYRIERGRLKRVEPNLKSNIDIPQILSDPTIRRSRARERACDVAAEKLGKLVFGLPCYHPLLKDARKRLKILKASFKGRYRRLTLLERQHLGLPSWIPVFVADISSLDRAATAADVKAGKAIFHFGGKGKLVNVELPAVAIFKRDKKQEKSFKVLIVQAEARRRGEVTYGVIGRERFYTASAQELTNIKSIEELRKTSEIGDQ
jgi:hypothetical protein